jgi:hypothetical protein
MHFTKNVASTQMKNKHTFNAHPNKRMQSDASKAGAADAKRYVEYALRGKLNKANIFPIGSINR